MLSDLDIWRAAQATIKRYGDEAGIHAAQRADDLLTASELAKLTLDADWVTRRR